MDLWVLDRAYETLAILDVYRSLAWVDRFKEAGEFSIQIPMAKCDRKIIAEGNYVMLRQSDRYMIIETIETEESRTDNDGDMVTVSGRSLESILERRVIWNQLNFDKAPLSSVVKKIIDDNFINAEGDRKIPNFIWEDPDSGFDDGLKTVTSQFYGENVYEVVTELLSDNDVGMRLLPYGSGGVKMKLLRGVDRSYAQSTRPFVVFSPKYDNFLSSRSVESKVDLKTAVLLLGEPEPEEKDLEGNVIKEASEIKRRTSYSTGEKGLDRREIFLDTGLSTTEENSSGESVNIPNDRYMEMVKGKGKEELAQHKITASSDGEIEARIQFLLHQDFEIGDVVQVITGSRMSFQSRVTEIMYAHDSDGESILPTFTTVNGDKIEYLDPDVITPPSPGPGPDVPDGTNPMIKAITKSNYDALSTSEKEANILYIIVDNEVNAEDIGNFTRPITKADYDSLSDIDKNANILYVITSKFTTSAPNTPAKPIAENEYSSLSDSEKDADLLYVTTKN